MYYTKIGRDLKMCAALRFAIRRSAIRKSIDVCRIQHTIQLYVTYLYIYRTLRRNLNVSFFRKQSYTSCTIIYVTGNADV